MKKTNEQQAQVKYVQGSLFNTAEIETKHDVINREFDAAVAKQQQEYLDVLRRRIIEAQNEPLQDENGNPYVFDEHVENYPQK